MPNSKVTVDVNEIWDDESGSPSPLSVPEVDARIMVANQALHAQSEAMERLNSELESVIAKRAALIERMNAQWQQFQQEANLLSTSERETRRRAKLLLKQANGMV